MFKKMIITHTVLHSTQTSQTIVFQREWHVVIPQAYLNGEVIPVVDSDKHLGNYISTNITDRNIIDNRRVSRCK